MSHYRPKWLTLVGVAISLIMSFAWPLYGLIYCNLLFIMMKRDKPDFDFVGERNFWCGMFLLLVAGIGLTNFI
jgi:hypothetical protein